MRLRQVALVARDLEGAADALCSVLGLTVSYRDPGVSTWGLDNVVMPLGGNFLEVVSPHQPGTSAGRYLDRRGGDGGYMVILQTADAVAERARVTALGVRAVWETDRPTYRATHFHPSDVGGVLLSIDSVEPGADWTAPMCAWPPAGPQWPAAVSTSVVRDLVGVEIQSEKPESMAELWSRILARPTRRLPGGACQIDLVGGAIRFVPTADDRGPGVRGIDLHVADRARLTAAARARAVPVADDHVVLCGTRIAFASP
jgi:hypothetical protein